jgi:hypothetical protein
MLKHLKTLLKSCGILTHFDPINNWVYCYAHTINLSCKAVVGLIPDDAEEAQDDEPLSCHPVALALHGSPMHLRIELTLRWVEGSH